MRSVVICVATLSTTLSTTLDAPQRQGQQDEPSARSALSSASARVLVVLVLGVSRAARGIEARMGRHCGCVQGLYFWSLTLLNPFWQLRNMGVDGFSDVLVVGSVHGCRFSGGQPFAVPLGRYDAHGHRSLTQAVIR